MKKLLGQTKYREIVEAVLNKDLVTISGFNGFNLVSRSQSADNNQYLTNSFWSHKVTIDGIEYQSGQKLIDFPKINEDLQNIYDTVCQVDGVYCSNCSLFHDTNDYYNKTYIISNDSEIYCKDCISFDDLVSEITEPNQLFKIKDVSGIKVPDNFEEVETLFCDSSGFGSSGESALTKDQTIKRVQELLSEYSSLFGGITDIGQFQVYVTLWEKVG